jgi:hypothetical protein
MNENYPPFRLPRPEISDRKPEKPRFVPLAAEAVARRQEVARLLGAKIDAVSKSLRHLSDEQRKAIFVKLEHEGTLDLGGTGLKPITQSDHLTLAVPRGDEEKGISPIPIADYWDLSPFLEGEALTIRRTGVATVRAPPAALRR